jgi:hypothetical protein
VLCFLIKVNVLDHSESAKEKVFGSIIKGILNNSFLGSFIINKIAKRIEKKEIGPDPYGIISEQTPLLNVDMLDSIVTLCLGMLDRKNGISINRLNTLKDSFRRDFKFDKDEMSILEDLINDLMSSATELHTENAFVVINIYCKYEEKLLIAKLLFFTAKADTAEISRDELDYIFECCQRMMILSSDYSYIKKDFVRDESDPFGALGITSKASNKEIKTAFRKMIVKFHPDIAPGNESTANLEFQKITTAYSKLKKIRHFN